MLIPLLIAVCFSLIVFYLVQFLFDDSAKIRVEKRLESLMSDTDIEDLHEAVLREKRNRQKPKRKYLLISQKFEESLVMSGIKLSAEEYMVAWACTTFLPILLLSALGKEFVTVLAAGIIGFAIPPILVQRARVKRNVLFNKQLSESLTIMSNCMRSGYSFQQAMQSIATEMPPPISTEFGRVVREMSYGVSMEQALTNMVSRVNNSDLALLVSAVLTSAQIGANLSEILDTIADTVRDRIKLRGEVRILSAQGRISGVIIGLLPVVIILVLMLINPTYFSGFVSTVIGKVLIVVSIMMEALGFFVISRITNITY